MKTKTLAGLVRELRGALEYYYHAQPHGHWSLVEEILDALDEAALARPAAVEGAVEALRRARACPPNRRFWEQMNAALAALTGEEQR
jgi:hypothetical protein